MTDLSAAKGAYNSQEWDDIGWISTTDNLADAVTKERTNKGLQEFLDTGIVMQEISQWVVKKGENNTTTVGHDE